MEKSKIDFADIPETTSKFWDKSELLELVSERVKEAIKETRKTRKHLDKTLKKIGSN